MKNQIVTSLYVLFLVSCFNISLFGQNVPKEVTIKEKQEVIKSIGELLTEHYIYENSAKEMAESLSSRLEKGAYDEVVDPMVFAKMLGEDLQAISNDKHIRVRFDPEWIVQSRGEVSEADSIAFMAEYKEEIRMNNYGFKEVKILEGNIGYLHLTSFEDPEFGGEVATSAMNFLSNSNALIIDLRQNGGGSPAMIQLISSYLFDAQPQHLNNFYTRTSTEPKQTWTLPYVPGKRSPEIPVYVLTSNYTFSAAEEFSYNLRNMERATLVGETTGGGAHPGGSMAATDRFLIWVPTGRAENPISKTNWEGTGVEPHIPTTADKALEVAHMKAMETLRERYKNGKIAFQLEWALAGLNAKLNPVNIPLSTLHSYAGNYGDRVLTIENGKLFYQRKDRAKYELKPLSNEIFMMEEIPYFRLEVLKEGGKVIGLKGLYDNGRSDKSIKG